MIYPNDGSRACVEHASNVHQSVTTARSDATRQAARRLTRRVPVLSSVLLRRSLLQSTAKHLAFLRSRFTVIFVEQDARGSGHVRRACNQAPPIGCATHLSGPIAEEAGAWLVDDMCTMSPRYICLPHTACYNQVTLQNHEACEVHRTRWVVLSRATYIAQHTMKSWSFCSACCMMALQPARSAVPVTGCVSTVCLRAFCTQPPGAADTRYSTSNGWIHNFGYAQLREARG